MITKTRKQGNSIMLTVPKEFDVPKGVEVEAKLVENGILYEFVEPKKEFFDFSEDVLADILSEGYNKQDILNAPESWQACLGMMQAFQHNNYQDMAQYMVDMGMTHEKERVDINQLAVDLENMIATFVDEDKLGSGKVVNSKEHADDLNKMMLEIVEVGKRHGIHFPRDFALLTKQMLYFDRFMRTLAPDMDIFSDARVSMMPRK